MLGAEFQRCDALAVRVMTTDFACLPAHVLKADPDLPLDSGWQIFTQPLPRVLAVTPTGPCTPSIRLFVVPTVHRHGDVPYRRWKGLRRAYLEACICRALL